MSKKKMIVRLNADDALAELEAVYDALEQVLSEAELVEGTDMHCIVLATKQSLAELDAEMTELRVELAREERSDMDDLDRWLRRM